MEIIWLVRGGWPMILPGHCMVCDKDLNTACGHCGANKLSDQYTEVEMEWTNGSKMKVAICVPCATHNAHSAPENKDKITKAHQNHWQEMGATYDPGIILV